MHIFEPLDQNLNMSSEFPRGNFDLAKAIMLDMKGKNSTSSTYTFEASKLA